MKKKLIFLLLPVAALLLLTGCKKESVEKADILNLGGDTWTDTDVDVWLRDSLNTPYNIQTKYRWDAFELELDKTLVPPYMENVVPMMKIIKRGLIEVYGDEVSPNFIKTFVPKQYVLVGSVAYNANGSVTLGEAEAGRKVTIYRVNQLNMKDTAFVKRILKTNHHEFGHILQQNISISPDFQAITPGYTADWTSIADTTARKSGFITAYAMSEPNEDFVEMLSIMLTEGKTGYEAIVAAQTTTAQALLRQKEQMVVDYLKQNYNIDLYSLQTRARSYLLSLLKG